MSLQCYYLSDEHCTLFFFDYTFHKQAHFVFAGVFYHLLANIHTIYRSIKSEKSNILVQQRHMTWKGMALTKCCYHSLVNSMNSVCLLVSVLSITKSNIFNTQTFMDSHDKCDLSRFQELAGLNLGQSRKSQSL